MPQMKPGFLYISLGVATLAVSWASIIIVWADADPITTAFYRMAFAVLILAPFSIPRLVKHIGTLTKSEKGLLALSGVLLGFHFASWIASLKYTTIANSVVIVATAPFFVAILEALLLKEKISRNTILGMVLAFIGMTVISRSDFHLGPGQFKGDILALIGAVCAGGYLIVGRKIRQKLLNRHYVFPVYAIAAITLLAISIPLKSPLTGFPGKTWLCFLLLAIIPTIMGHTLYNFLLKYIRAHLVAITVLGEPIGAAILAAIVFAEYPSLATFIGGALILAGIATALLRLKSDTGKA